MLKSLKNKFNSLSQCKKDRIRTIAHTAIMTASAVGSATLLQTGIVAGLGKAAALTSAFLFANATIFKTEATNRIKKPRKKLASTTAIITFLTLAPLAHYSATKYSEEIVNGLKYVDEALVKDSSQKNKKEKELVQKAPFKINI